LHRHLISQCWLTFSYDRFGIKECQRHGEAGSVNLADVQVERARMKKIMAPYAPEDQFNGDESQFYPLCPPDVSLTTKLTASGKKKIKNAITAFFITNETGTEKEEVVFIGKAKKP
jgi:hypothetical protein